MLAIFWDNADEGGGTKMTIRPTHRAAEGQWPRQRARAEDLAPVGRQTHVVACGDEGVRSAKTMPVGPYAPGHRDGRVSMRRYGAEAGAASGPAWRRSHLPL